MGDAAGGGRLGKVGVAVAGLLGVDEDGPARHSRVEARSETVGVLALVEVDGQPCAEDDGAGLTVVHQGDRHVAELGNGVSNELGHPAQGRGERLVVVPHPSELGER